MRLKHILEEIMILPWSEDYGMDGGDEYDPWVAADQADNIANLSNIRIDSTKELSYVAIDGDQVVGALWSSLKRDQEQEEEEVWVYGWDVAVHPEHRNARIGLSLIDTAMEDYHTHQSEHDKIYMKVWAVNPKLARVLERKYGFEVESDHGEGGSFMVFHESYEGLPDEDEFAEDSGTYCGSCDQLMTDGMEWYWAEKSDPGILLTAVVCSSECIENFLIDHPGWELSAESAIRLAKLHESYE